MAVDHYENFPVASLILPRPLRAPVAAIYRFARHADDLADEGDLPAAQRLIGLRALQSGLTAISQGIRPPTQLLQDLADVVAAHRLPVQLFEDLLDAFTQDVTQSRYADFPQLMDYCRRSANPVGRLLLHLFGYAHGPALDRSDDICSALQLINHWQDVAIDYSRNRIYLPQDDLARFGVDEGQLASADAGPRFQQLLRFQIGRARALLHRGAPLGRTLPGRLGLEIRMIVAGGDTILQKLLERDCDVFRRRPKLIAPDWLAMVVRAVAGDGTIGK
jgi:squalene synthase HpnC